MAIFFESDYHLRLQAVHLAVASFYILLWISTKKLESDVVTTSLILAKMSHFE
ncbi:hypothetical protein HanRHA438_Chr07g0302481 [Helianthus annuus]|uniref:Uncharacterized protein n=1 Tax=Helianthus annuus TaxID=4232 RepID=A0A9K3IK83_HELAN|nr:hypothetical protein HanXRQr2_Chr07g0291991 [Helianthus annuus]KAJ0904486.1 hypothetical protein HanPSC8_Chr07g0282771 [Helianthus annuus]KAJ0907729.1 hypothetical protein HanRHA438_Chr07g0302481 [Helianthus annuus]